MAFTYSVDLYGHDENDNVINYYSTDVTHTTEVMEFLQDAARYGQARPENVTGFEVILDGQNMGGLPYSSLGGDKTFTSMYSIVEGSSLELWFITDIQRGKIEGKGYEVNSHTLAYFPLKEHLLNAITYDDTYWSDFTLRVGNHTDGINSTLGGEKCFRLEGINNGGGAYSELIPIPQGNAPRTISCWLYPQAFNEEDNPWAYGTAQVYNTYGALHKLNPLGFGCWGTPMATETSLPLNEWSNVMVTYSGGDAGVYKIYYMGELVGEQWLATDTQGTQLCIGYNPGVPDGTNTLYKGGINELFIEDREWTAGEIKDYVDIYTGKKKREGKQTTLTTCKGISKYSIVNGIKSDGHQYIDTGIHFEPGKTFTFEATYKFDGDSSGFGHHRCAIAQSGGELVVLNTPMGQVREGFNTVSIQGSAVNNIEEAVTFNATLNGQQAGSIGGWSWYDTHNLLLFAITGREPGRDVYVYTEVAIKNVKLYIGDKLERDFYPCMNTTNKELGMIDKVHNVYYPNLGTGAFTLVEQ